MKKRLLYTLSLFVALCLAMPMATMPASANPGSASFADTNGHYRVTPGIDVGPMAVSPKGNTLFAAVAPDDYIGPGGDYSDWYRVLKSVDGGNTWVATGFYDTSPIVDIVVSPKFVKDRTVFVATMNTVYKSVDSGKKFVCMTESLTWSGMIRDLDVALDDSGQMAIMVGTWNGANGGDVYVFSTATGLNWQEQLIGWDVLACAFLPNYTDAGGEMGICAVVSDGSSTWMRFSFSNTAEGGGWGWDIHDAQFLDAYGYNFGSVHARIAFPDDFDAWGIGKNVCFVGIYSYAGYYDPYDAKGDVYKIVLKEAGVSQAIDLDIRGELAPLLPTATDIVSIDVSGNAEDCHILVGTNYSTLIVPQQFLVYYSNDGGETWKPSAKPPTGGDEVISGVEYIGAMTYVLMKPNSANSGIAYASTWGDCTSAFFRTTNGGKSWKQISLVDTGS